jgi:DNA repair exonuclease SbcCD ATPase subunit
LVFKISRKAQIEQNLKRVIVDGSESDSDTSEDAIQALDDRICAEKEKLNEKRDIFERADALLDTWNAWRREQEKYERRLAELDMRRKARENAEKNERKAAEKLKEASLALKGAEELKSAVLEAESLALVSLVNQINDHAATYLDVFFAEDPIEASLKTFTALKGKKKMKPSIQTEIQFKGNEMKLDGLSGGEQARVVVAFNLALCEILASPIIMLDEVTANLDADLTETIYDTIKASTDNKIVLAVAHQCIDGTFDHIIRVC